MALAVAADGSDPLRSRLVGLAFACAESEAHYLPLGHQGLDGSRQLRVERAQVAGPAQAALQRRAAQRYVREVATPDHVARVAPRGLATWSRTITLLTPWMQSGATIAAVAAAVAAN